MYQQLSKQKQDRMAQKLSELLTDLTTACELRILKLGRGGSTDVHLARSVQSYYAREAERLRDTYRAALRGDMLARFDERIRAFNMTGTRCESIDSDLGRKYVPIKKEPTK